MMPRYTSTRTSQFGDNGRAHGIFGVCPPFVSNYMATHMDSIPKILNHVLAFALFFDIMLFFSSFQVSFLPTLGFNTTSLSLLLVCQTVVVWLILNNHRVPVASFLAPTEFKVGLAFGLSVGAAILSFMVSHAFRNSSHLCDPFHVHHARSLFEDVLEQNPPDQPPPPPGSNTNSSDVPPTPPGEALTNDQQQQAGNMNMTFAPMDFLVLCNEHSGSIGAVWFWAGLSFWCNFGCCLLLSVGKSELSSGSSTQYQQVNVEDAYGTGQSSSQAASGNAFVGDYATVPEIRSDHSNNQRGGGGINSSVNSGYGPTGGYSDQPQLTNV